MPFDRTGISIRVLRSDPVGVVLRADDPLARRDTLQVSDLDGRRWFQFPEGTDPLWRAYWNCTTPGGTLRDGPVVRTVSECVQAVFWSGAIGLAPLAPLPLRFRRDSPWSRSPTWRPAASSSPGTEPTPPR